MLLEVQHVRKEFQNRTLALPRKQFQRSGEVLRDVSFTLGDGEFLSVIGPSGAGKTTLFRILNGSLRCDGGAILVNGVHFESADRRTRRAIQTTIGTIYQDFCLVENTSSLQNVLNACLPEMSLGAALLGLFGRARTEKAAGILREVGLEDKLSEPVKRLSGGQKQRVAIARVFLKAPPILILDEATSALDSVTEARIQGAFDRLARGRTTLIIAHRLSTIRSADRILVIQDGVVAEQGSHQELMAKNGVYATLYRTQNLGA